MTARGWWGAATVALVVAAASIGLAGTALAHPALLGSRPAAGAELVASPSELSVTFSEPVAVSGDALVVHGPQGLIELVEAPAGVDGGRTVVARPAVALPAGSYTFGWTVVAGDGDLLTGTVVFTVSAAAATTPARPPPYSPVDPDGAAGGSTAGAATGVALRWLLFLGLSLALGGAVGGRLVAGVPGFGAPQPPLAFGAGLIAVAATGSALHTLGAGDPVTGMLSLPATGLADIGAAPAVQIAAGLIAVVLALCRCRRWLVVAPLLIVIAAEAVRSHLQTASGWPGAVLLAVHLGAAAVWVGALLFVLSAGWAQRRVPRLVLVRFAALSTGLFATVLVTGTAAALLLVDDVQALVTTAYGRTLLLKLTLVAVVTGLAIAGRAAVSGSASARTFSSGRLARLEAGTLVGVLAVTALLLSLSPPPTAAPPAPPTGARQAR